MNIIKFSSINEFILESVKFVTDQLKKSQKTNIALSGGNTPRPIYESLGEIINFDLVNFYQVDERYVCKTHKSSNFQMIDQSIYINYKNDLFRFDTSLKIENCLAKYTKELQKIPNQTFDLTILGMGPDGHIASLFPNTFDINEEKLCINTQTNTFDIKERLSISPKMIINSKKILVLLKGEDKKDILNQIENSNKSIEEFPAMMLKKHADVNIYFCE